MNVAKEGASPLNSLEVIATRGEGACNNGEVQKQRLPASLSTPLLSKAAINDPSTDP